MCALKILYADQALIVSVKPSGLLAVPGRGLQKQDCLSARVQQQFDDALIVHRLDMGTSGLMVLVRGLEMQRRLQRQFALGQVNKGYVAIVSGRPNVPAMQWQRIDAALRVDWPNRPRSMIDPVHGKPSRTRWRLLDAPEAHPALQPGFSRPRGMQGAHAVLELMPETGRSHQIRVHLDSIGHPIAGDALYGDAISWEMAPRLLLHAWFLDLQHPLTGQQVQWQCPADFGCEGSL
ncbi:MAG: RluA family pseudouridine synthase [Brachymonas sp.]